MRLNANMRTGDKDDEPPRIDEGVIVTWPKGASVIHGFGYASCDTDPMDDLRGALVVKVDVRIAHIPIIDRLRLLLNGRLKVTTKVPVARGAALGGGASEVSVGTYRLSPLGSRRARVMQCAQRWVARAFVDGE